MLRELELSSLFTGDGFTGWPSYRQLPSLSSALFLVLLSAPFVVLVSDPTYCRHPRKRVLRLMPSRLPAWTIERVRAKLVAAPPRGSLLGHRQARQAEPKSDRVSQVGEWDRKRETEPVRRLAIEPGRKTSECVAD